MTTRNLSLHDHTALAYLAEGRQAATYRVAQACRFDRVHGTSATTKARIMLKRLERWGLVEGVTYMGGYVYWWSITDAGRKAVQP